MGAGRESGMTSIESRGARRSDAAGPLGSLMWTAMALLALSSGWAFRAVAADDLNALSQDDKQWVMSAKNYANTRFSGLDQINAGNVGELQPAWTFSLGADRGEEAAPLVVDGTMYVVGPYPNYVYALDATTGEMIWNYRPDTDSSSQGVACCDVVNRGAAYDNGKIFFNTLDDYTIALDAKTGKELWQIKLDSIDRGATITMAPLVVRGKVLVGVSGGELGVRGWLTALDENTGKIAWRAYSTGSDADVLIGPGFKPFYADLQGKDLGIKSWPPDHWKIGGGTTWGWIQYDPGLNAIYYGTANPGPWNANQRPGDNHWTNTIFARNPDSGSAYWAYQTLPHDLFDHDEINESILLDLPINGQTRKVLVHVARSGIMYVMDRTNGEVLTADPYDTNNYIKGLDGKTGRPILNEEKLPVLGKDIQDVCPAAPGAKDWQPSAWSPKTHLLYVPHQHLCMNWKTAEVSYIAGTPYVGATVDMYAGPGGYRGEFMAWDPVARKKVWAIHENFPVWSGALVTAGDLAFYGTMDRWFKAVDAKSGKELWKFRTGSGIIGQSVTYQGRDGVQYVAVLAGVGGWPGVIAQPAAELDPRVRNGALGFTGAMQDLPTYTSAGGTLYVFAVRHTQTASAAGTPGPQAGAQPEPGHPNPQPEPGHAPPPK